MPVIQPPLPPVLNQVARDAVQLVGTRCGLNNQAQANSAQPGYASRTRHKLPYGAKCLWPVYAAFRVTSSAANDTETALPGGFGWYASSATVVAGGTGYAVGDRVTVTVATNQFSPTLQVEAVSGGVVTALSVVDGGGFGAVPSTGLATVKVAGSGDNALTVTLGLTPCAMVVQAALEQVYATQTAFSNSNLTGVMKFTAGFNATLGRGNIPLPYTQPVEFDRLNVGLDAGSTIGLRLYTPSTGMYIGRYLKGSATLNEYAATNVNLSSATPTGGTYPTSSGPIQGFQPVAIMGIPQTPGPSWAIIGDSIGYGNSSTTFDTGDADGYYGYCERSIGPNAPFTNLCTPADRLELWLSQTNSCVRQRLIQDCNISHIFDEMGVNDFRAGTTFSTFFNQKIKFWQMLKGLGVKEIWAATITPVTTSTDGVSALPTIASGGTGYAASSTFDVTIAGGTGTAAVINVSTNGSGVVTTVNSITNVGSYTVTPSTPNSPTGGTGSGLSLNLVFAGWLNDSMQTIGSAGSNIVVYNAALRAGTFSQYVRAIDLGTTVESTSGSGKWASGATTDGVHPALTQMSVIAAPLIPVIAQASL